MDENYNFNVDSRIKGPPSRNFSKREYDSKKGYFFFFKKEHLCKKKRHTYLYLVHQKYFELLYLEFSMQYFPGIK